MYQLISDRSSSGKYGRKNFSFFHFSLAGAFLLVCLDSAPGLAADPSHGNWRWPQALAKLNALADSIGSTCRLWTERYGTNSVRAWKRCGVNSTSSSAKVIDRRFLGESDFIDVNPSTFCPGPGCSKTIQNGDGTLGNISSGSGSFPPTSGTFKSNLTCSGSQSPTCRNGPGLIINNYNLSCIGTRLSGTFEQNLSTAPLEWANSTYFRDESTANNTVSATCKSADTLLIDFGPVAPDCDNSWLVSGFINGRSAVSGSCDCIPQYMAIDVVTPGPVCAFIPIVGDPGRMGGDVGDMVGKYIQGPGHTFTNEDLANMGGEIPTVGSSENGGLAEGYNGTGAQGGSAPTGGTGTGPGGGVGSGGSGTGSSCASQNCNDDGSPDVGTIPTAPEYNSDLETVTEQSWTDAISDFITSSPLTSIFAGGGLATSGATCVMSMGEYRGQSLSLDICGIPGLTAFPPVLLALAHLTAIFIVFRR